MGVSKAPYSFQEGNRETNPGNVLLFFWGGSPIGKPGELRSPADFHGKQDRHPLSVG